MSKGILLGIPINGNSFDETLSSFENIIKTNKSNKKSSYIATVNTDFVVNTLYASYKKIKNINLLKTLIHAEWVTADGMPIVWAIRGLGFPIKERVTGADLFKPLLNLAEAKKWKIYFLGGKESEAKLAIEKIRNEFPKLKIVGSNYPMIQSIDSNEEIDFEIIKDINLKKPDILFLSFGNPKQEIWYYRNRSNISIPFVMGIGGTLNFYLGKIQRAPRWMQISGLEWVYRLKEEPIRLFKRYLIDALLFSIMFIPLLVYYQFLFLVNAINKNGNKKLLQANKMLSEIKDSNHFSLEDWKSEDDLIKTLNKMKLKPDKGKIILNLNGIKACNHEDIYKILILKKECSKKNISIKIISNRLIKLQLYLQRII
ncbi:MAG: hypothetical protein CK427_10370 [Leptospira sp.]|nr:MAG: hypothetical protein CK427_10370 [Leptospira sp.]